MQIIMATGKTEHEKRDDFGLVPYLINRSDFTSTAPS
jgi:hypothetical protein